MQTTQSAPAELQKRMSKVGYDAAFACVPYWESGDLPPLQRGVLDVLSRAQEERDTRMDELERCQPDDSASDAQWATWAREKAHVESGQGVVAAIVAHVTSDGADVELLEALELLSDIDVTIVQTYQRTSYGEYDEYMVTFTRKSTGASYSEEMYSGLYGLPPSTALLRVRGDLLNYGLVSAEEWKTLEPQLDKLFGSS